MAKQCLLELHREFPGCNQIVYEYSHSVVVGLGRSDRGYEATVCLAIYPDELRLYFNDGKELPDPARRLQGSGSKVRFVVLESAGDLGHPEIGALMTAARERAGGTFEPNGGTRTILKATSKQKATKQKATKKAPAKATPTKKPAAKAPAIRKPAPKKPTPKPKPAKKR